MDSFSYRDLGLIKYNEALAIQTQAFDSLLDAKATGGVGFNQLFFCEHEPVLTFGKSAKESNLLVPESLLRQRGVSIYKTNRGGDVTFHGPGQITGYPIFDLESFQMGLKQYIYTLEEVILRFLTLYNIKGSRSNGATGVWLDAEVPQKARKICAIGVKSSRYVTMHGFALNVNTDLHYFTLINPCGFTDKGVTSLAKELGAIQDFELAKKQLQTLFRELFLVSNR